MGTSRLNRHQEERNNDLSARCLPVCEYGNITARGMWRISQGQYHRRYEADLLFQIEVDQAAHTLVK